jgi:endonuclease/exonuclease/phosphatase family metal-dependent hydrolase
MMINNIKPVYKPIGLFNSLVLIINIIFVLALLLSYLSVHVSPQKSWILPFFGLLYPYFVLINLFLGIYWIIRRRWLFLLSATIIVSGWNHVNRTVQIRPAVIKPAGKESFKVISYNVKNLSNDNIDLLEPEIRQRIVDYLDAEGADIICLQEFTVIHPFPESFIDTVSGRFGLPYHTYSLYYEKNRKRIDAMFIFSRFPVIGQHSFKKDSLHNYALYADLITPHDTIRLYNIHLESLRLKHEDYTFISDLDLQFEEKENLRESSKRIFKKLKKAFSLRADQVETLAGSIKNSPYPVILCGDFNDTPNSYAYQQLTSLLRDAFKESGQGMGNTYIGKLPSYRIDFILYSDYYRSWELQCDHLSLSDHYPVSCLIGARQ